MSKFISSYFRGASPEFLNLWRHASALLAGVQTITPVFFMGAIAGTEYLTYDAKKLYIAFYVVASYNSSTSFGIVNSYNEANAISAQATNNSAYWNATTAAVNSSSNKLELHNLYFSRLLFSGYTYLLFNGFKITVP